MPRGAMMDGGGLPLPGPALRGALFTVFGVWLAFAVAINWGDAGVPLFEFLCGNRDAIIHGQVWRLLTAGFMHNPSDVGHILFACIGLYFLTPSLEARWGSARMARFFVLSSLIAYVIQFALSLALPELTTAKLVPEFWFGSLPIVEAIAIAWACSFEGQTIRLFFVIPVTSRGLILFVIGFSVLRVIALSSTSEGLLSPFGGMFAGWLLGASTPSPLRRLYLKFRLSQLDKESRTAKVERGARVRKSGLRIIDGGKGDSNGGTKGPDGKWLN